MLDAIRYAICWLYHYLVPHFVEDIAVLNFDAATGQYCIVGSIDSVPEDYKYDAWIRWDVFTWMGLAYPVTSELDFKIQKGRYPGFDESAESAGGVE